jgi:hypothetical protein
MNARLEAELSKIAEHREGLEPSSPQYGCGVLATGRPVRHSVGLAGIEPTSSGLRDRCITLSATIPFQSARWELNPRPASYKDAALTAELRASASRAGGIRTHAMRIKSPPCCLLHHDPVKRSGVCVSSGVADTSFHLLFGLVVSGSPENRTRHNAVISRVWTTSPRLPCLSRARAESNRPRRRPQTANSAPAPEAGVLPSAPLPVCCQSERPDLNRRSPGPRPGAIPGFATF